MDDEFIKITNGDVYKELKVQGEVQKELLTHVKETNGKVALAFKMIESERLEREKQEKLLQEELDKKVDSSKSFGAWVYAHPIKFTSSSLIVFTVLSAMFISDIRHPLFELIKTLR